MLLGARRGAAREAARGEGARRGPPLRSRRPRLQHGLPVRPRDAEGMAATARGLAHRQPLARAALARAQRLQDDDAARRELIAGTVADGQSHRLELADVRLEPSAFVAERRRERDRRYVRSRFDRFERCSRPRAELRRAIEAIELLYDLREIVEIGRAHV